MTQPIEQNILLQTPVAVQVGATDPPPRLVFLSKMFSWAALVLLLVSVILALLTAADERDKLRDQVKAQSDELICKEEADDEVTVAAATRDGVMSEALAALAANDELLFEVLTEELKVMNIEVDREISEMKQALEQCDQD